MSKLHRLFEQHATLSVAAIILLPLVALLALQYHALARLEEASPAAEKVSHEKRLVEVVDEIDRSYLAEARAALDVAPTRIVDGSPTDDVSVFAGVPAEGVSRFFIASLYEKRRAKITTYNPVTGVADGDSSDSPIFWAIYSASVHTLNQMMAPHPTDSTPIEFDEKDPKYRVALKPIVDGRSHIVGVAGILVDREWYATTYLPRALERAMGNHFSSGDMTGMRAVVWDDEGATINGDGVALDRAEVVVPLNFAYSKWRLGLVPIGPSQTQLARRYFAVTLGLSILMTLVITGAVWASLRAAARELRLSQMKTDFVANVSHELRTPLASIRVFGELMKSGRVRDDRKVREYGELIENESTRLTQLINNILDFSRIESGQKTYDFEPVALDMLTAETVRAFGVRARQLGFEIRYEPPAEPLPIINADPSAVAQALVNLLDNAAKYSRTSREIVIRARHERGYAIISVSDRGIGIPLDEQKLIFNRFHRSSSSLVHDVKGSGLGLALVKHVAESHAGFVTVDSRPSVGSTFTLHFPVDARLASTPELDAEPMELAT